MLEFSRDLATGNAEIDGHHVAFIDTVNALEQAGEADLVARLEDLLAHCQAHFGFENRQMEQSAFPPIGCHTGEHEMVLQTVSEVLRRARGGETQFARNLCPALVEWFGNHARSMDMVLALHLAGATDESRAGRCSPAPVGAV